MVISAIQMVESVSLKKNVTFLLGQGVCWVNIRPIYWLHFVLGVTIQYKMRRRSTCVLY